MENSCLFIRGQVWYWEDPIYGRKENNIEVSIGEASIRYSRYCVVAQTTNTIDKSSVLVIPCSSSNHTPHDVPAPLTHVFHENFTYGRTRGVFPVHPKFLQRYVCTLPDSVMKQMEVELIKLLIPSIYDGIDKTELLDRFGLNVESPTFDSDAHNNPQTWELNLRSFLKDHLIKADSKEVISVYELKDAFNQYCTIHRFGLVDDIVEFLDVFTKLTGNNGYHFADKSRYNIIEFRGLQIRGNLKLTLNVSELDIINPNDPQRPGKWNDDSIRSFLVLYNDDGVDAASEKFGLKPSTATNYWYKWKDSLELEKSPTVIPRIPITVDTPRSISKVANMIRDSLKDESIYSKMDISRQSNITDQLFYSVLGTCIYYSLLEFLSIRKDETGNFFCPNLNESSKYLPTWHFFDKSYHDRRVSLIKTGHELIIAYKKYFPQYKGIDSDWISKLRIRLINKLNISESDINKVCDIIKNTYCDI